jgi:hypothetical protein
LDSRHSTQTAFLLERDIIGIDLLDQKLMFPVMMAQEKKGSIIINEGKVRRKIEVNKLITELGNKSSD